MRSWRPFCCGCPGSIHSQPDAELDPAHHQAAKTTGAGGGERRAVVGADRQRQPVRPEGGLDHRPDPGHGRRDDLAGEQVAAGGAGAGSADRSARRRRSEPSLKSIAHRSCGWRTGPNGWVNGGGARWRRRGTAETFPPQQRADRRGRRPRHLGLARQRRRPQLLGPPEWPRPAQRQDRRRRLRRQRPAMLLRRARTRLQPAHPGRPIAPQQLVAPLPADPERSAQRRHRPLPAQQRHHEPQLLVVHTSLPKRHRPSPPKPLCRAGNPSTTCPVQPLTYPAVRTRVHTHPDPPPSMDSSAKVGLAFEVKWC